MKTKLLLLGIFVAGSVLFPLRAQKGTGEIRGVVREGTPTLRTEIRGTVVEVKQGACETTTGKSETGRHYMLKAADDEVLNLHLGPESALRAMNAPEQAGFDLEASVFRTERMQENHWVVIHFTAGETQIRLRDDALRPVWAGQPRSGSRRRVKR